MSAACEALHHDPAREEISAAGVISFTRRAETFA
jgi:hypothetical protein